jgi:predicted lipase
MIDLIRKCKTLCQASYIVDTKGFNNHEDMRFGVFVVKNTAFIVVRGTKNITNGLRDILALPVVSPKGYLCHAGFMSGYKEIITNVKHKLRKLDNHKLVFTGHSFGGAVATLLCEYFGGTLVTFGSPRVYFRFSTHPELNHIRVIRDDDPIPLMPYFTYCHRTEPYIIKDKDKDILDISDHYIKGYLNENITNNS